MDFSILYMRNIFAQENYVNYIPFIAVTKIIMPRYQNTNKVSIARVRTLELGSATFS